MQRSFSFLRTIVLPIIALSLITGCGTGSHSDSEAKSESSASHANASGYVNVPATAPKAYDQKISDKTPGSPVATEPAVSDQRKIIRNGELTIESDNPSEGQRRIASIAEEHGGFVVKSETVQSDTSGTSDGSPQHQAVSLVVRIPALHFAAAIDEIRGAGNRVIQERITGEDVTEQYIDLEARIKTKKALELQFLEILKQARNVNDALEVQTQVANVRTEVEQLEGKRRFLENQSSLSTITVNLRVPTPVVAANPTGIMSSIKQSFGDGADLAVTIVLGLVRFIILAIPVVVLILLPLGLMTKFVFSRIKVFGKAQDGTEIEQH